MQLCIVLVWIKLVVGLLYIGHWQADDNLNWQQGFLVSDALLRSYARAHGNLGVLDSIRKAGAIGSAWYVLSNAEQSSEQGYRWWHTTSEVP